MPKTSEILGLTPQEVYAAAFTASGEAGPGQDLGGVLQTILARRASSGQNIARLVKAPQQFVANDPYSLQQVTDPNYGRRIHGSRFTQAVSTLENPNLMSAFLQKGQGATQFRGQALLRNKRSDDIMFDPKGNFYFNKQPKVAQDLIMRLGQPSTLGLPQGGVNIGDSQAATVSPDDFRRNYVMSVISGALQTPSMFTPWQSGAEDQQIAQMSKPVDYFSEKLNDEDKYFGIRPLYMAGQ